MNKEIRFILCIIVATNILILLSPQIIDILSLIVEENAILVCKSLRVFFAFLSFSFLPGFLILLNLKFKSSLTEVILYSIGLGIFLLMFSGLFMSIFYPRFGVSKPLSLMPAIITLDLMLILLLVGLNKDSKYLKSIGKDVKNITRDFLKKYGDSKSILSFFSLMILPFLSIIGTRYMNATESNTVLMFMLLLIMIDVALIGYFGASKALPNVLYLTAIFSVSISLLFMTSLRSNYVYGADINEELYVFKLVKENSFWDYSLLIHPYNTVLSVNVLPTLYSQLMDVSPDFVFKVLFNFLFSFAPLALYQLYTKYLDKNQAFLSTFFFIAPYFFFNMMPAVMKQEIALLLFVLCMLVLFDEKINKIHRRVLLFIFSFGIIVSHYATTYIFLIFMFTLFFLKLSLKSTSKRLPTTILRFFGASTIFLIVWYGLVTEVSFNNLLDFVINTIKNLNNFFLLESRSTAATMTLFAQPSPNLPYELAHIIATITRVFIVIGVLYLAKLAFKENSRKIDIDFILISLASLGLLVVFLVLPYVSYPYNLERVYLQSLVFLSVSFIIGSRISFERIFNRKISWILIIFILLLHFSFQSGFSHQFFGVPAFGALNNTGIDYDKFFIHDEEVNSAKWLSSNIADNVIVYADSWGRRRLWSYGMIPGWPGRNNTYATTFLFNTTIPKNSRVYVYLRYLNVVDGKIINENYEYESFQTTAMASDLSFINKIYDNGGSQIFKTK